MPDTKSSNVGNSDYSSLWYPYAQMKNLEVNLEVTEAHGVYLTMQDGKNIDRCYLVLVVCHPWL